MNIYIPIEIKSRELESKVLLALEAAKRGHEVLIGPLSIVFSWGPIGLLKPGVFHDKSLHPIANGPSIQRIVENGGVVTCMHEESGLLDESYDEFAKSQFGEDVLKNVSRVFGWGDFDTDALHRLFPTHKDKIIKTGSPRVDLWRNDIKPYYDFLEKGHRERLELENYILIPSNFGFTLNKNRFWQLLSLERENGDLSSLKNEEEWMDGFLYECKLIKEFIAMIHVLSRGFPDITIVIRPHPIEELNAWKELLGELPNVFVFREGSINRWVNNAKMVIHNGCTTAFEGRINKKPVIAYQPIQSPHERTIPNSISYRCTNISELKQQVQKCYSQKEEFHYQIESNEPLSDRVYIPNGSFSYINIVDEWEKLDSPELGLKNRWAYFSMRVKLSRVKKRAFYYFGLNNDKAIARNFSIAHKFQGLEYSELIKVVKAFQNFNSEFETVRVSKIDRKTFLFKK